MAPITANINTYLPGVAGFVRIIGYYNKKPYSDKPKQLAALSRF